jgi:hypothetical protein
MNVFGSINQHTWMFHFYEIVDISLEEFMNMFMELTMTNLIFCRDIYSGQIIVATTAYANIGIW